MAEQDHDRSEQATPFKLEEAKRRGQVSRSMDINAFVAVAGALVVMWLWGWKMMTSGLRLERAIFDRAHNFDFHIPGLIDWATDIALALGQLLAPFVVLIMVLGILSNMAQTGPIFSFFPLKPDPKRLNPVEGFKRVFSLKMLFEGVKTLIKLSLFATVAYFVIRALLPQVLGLIAVDPRAYPLALFDQISSLLFKLVLVLLAVALVDVLYTRWDYGKKMRMSRRELKEEVKRREGDPQVRAKIKELQREAAKRSKSVSRVPEADVLITNPTHYAVALKYERGTAGAPRVIAKGVNDMALTMRKVAARNGVPMMERRSLAQQLFREVDIDQPIPSELYEPIARVYADLYANKDAVVRGGIAS
ncbi:MAG: EscU/YscU/HrcU family type III secretion system export apparatus switch protein [Gammaproteobacteria bacterium]|nr:EscU/YscU/HrcU family type III secretion system export apparatus switch protein [Gammaproteobacteria bacterium]